MFAFSDCLLFVYRFLCNSPRSSAMCVFLDWIWSEDQSKQVFLHTTTSPLFQVRFRKKRNRGVIFSGDTQETLAASLISKPGETIAFTEKHCVQLMVEEAHIYAERKTYIFPFLRGVLCNSAVISHTLVTAGQTLED